MTDRSPVLVTLNPDTRATVHGALDPFGEVVYLHDLAPAQRAQALRDAPALLTLRPHLEIAAQDWPAVPAWRFVQFTSAGVDHVDFRGFPRGCTVACNAGGFSEPMAEHVLAMALALTKQLLPRHRALCAGEFQQFEPTGTLRGKTCAILGYGGIGRETARLARLLGMRIHGLNRRAAGDEFTDRMYAPDQLEAFLRSADLLVIAVPLTRATAGLLGRDQLAWLKPDVVIINVARGEIVDEVALYDFLVNHPQAGAGLDAWWTEPFRHGRFAMQRPFLDRPNVLGSPHNSPSVPGWGAVSLRRACENLARWLRAESPTGVLRWDENGVA